LAKTYKELPIYKETYSLIHTLVHAVKHMRKDLKLILGKDLIEDGKMIVLDIYSANSTRESSERIVKISDIEEKLQRMFLSVRLCKDMGAISITAYSSSVESLKKIEEQCSNWKKWCLKQGK